MEPSLELGCDGPPPEYDGAREKNDADHQADDPCKRHLGAREKVYDARNKPHKQTREKIKHRIAVLVLQHEHEICRDRRREHDRHRKIERYLQKTEEVCCDTPHHDRDNDHHGHLAG